MAKAPRYPQFGERVWRLRTRAGYRTQRAFADDFQIPPVNVSRWERGVVMPEGEHLSRLARALGVTVDFLLHGEVAA